MTTTPTTPTRVEWRGIVHTVDGSLNPTCCTRTLPAAAVVVDTPETCTARTVAQVAVEAIANAPEGYDAETIALVRSAGEALGIDALYLDGLPAPVCPACGYADNHEAGRCPALPAPEISAAEIPGPFGWEVERAITEDAKVPREPLVVCGVDGCGLAAGHVERAGTDHHPLAK